MFSPTIVGQYDLVFKPWIKFGELSPLFSEYAGNIEQFIKDQRLPQVDPQIFSPGINLAAMKRMEKSKEMLPYFDPGKFGGKRFAHLHFKGEVYMLNQRQWQDFTSQVKEIMIKKLEQAKNISLEQLMEISDAIDPIG
jgi:hypothetical protein